MGFSENDVYNLINRFTELELMTICNPTIKEYSHSSGEVAAGALFGSIAGALIGAIGGPVGVVVGGLVGALIGSGLSEEKEKIRTLDEKYIVFKK